MEHRSDDLRCGIGMSTGEVEREKVDGISSCVGAKFLPKDHVNWQPLSWALP